MCVNVSHQLGQKSPVMESKEMKALKKYADEIIQDLEPSSTFLHSLYAKNILTQDHIDIINGITSREQKVSKILQILPRRGPQAFTVFNSCLAKDYYWLEEKLSHEVQRLAEERIHINRKFINTIELKLDPLVYSEDESIGKCTESTNPKNIVKKLDESLTDFEKRCYKALCITSSPKKVPIPQLIERRIREEKKVKDAGKPEKDNKCAEEQVALTQNLKTERVQLQERLTSIEKSLTSTEAMLVPLVFSEVERTERKLPNAKSVDTMDRINETIIEHRQRCLKVLDMKPSQAKAPIHILITKRMKEERGKDIIDNSENSKDIRRRNKQYEHTKKENENLKKRMDYFRDKQKQQIKTSKDLKECQQENEKLKAENKKIREELNVLKEKPKDNACITSLFG